MMSTGRLTRQGCGALAVGAVMAVLGVRLGYPGVAGFGFALVGFVAFAAIALRKLPPLDLRREASPPAPGRLGDCTVTLKVRNRGRRAVRLEGNEPMGGTDLEVRVPYLPPGRTVHIRYPLPTQRRGPVVLGPLRLRRLGLAGLAAGEVSLPATHTVTVIPRLLPAAAPRGSLSVLVDDRKASYPPGAPDFDEAVDAAASLVAAAAGAGCPYAVHTMSLPALAGSTGGAGVAATVGQLATLALAKPAVDAPVRLAEPNVAVGVTGAAGDPAPMLAALSGAALSGAALSGAALSGAALSGAARAMLLIVDRRPDRMVTVAGDVLVLRAPRAEELLVAWGEVAAGRGARGGPTPGLEVR
jgi:uncharacterized protein (DUF58 family)